jgi:glycosyltransferase involved in cell wall biosynthesis
MNPKSTFSVVIPAYNAAETVGDAIASVLSQTAADFELIVVDDGSTDDTGTEIERFTDDPRVRHIRQPNAGLAATRNRALENARGSYASFLDADDLLLPHYLEVMGETLDAAPQAGFADCDLWILDDETGEVSTSPLGAFELPADPHELMRVLLRRNLVRTASTVRMDVLRRVGYFNTALRACEDLELWLRILAHGFAAVRAPDRLLVWRDRRDSMSTQALLMTSSLCEVYRLVADEYEVPDDIRALAAARRRAELKRLAALTGKRRLAAALVRIRRAVGRVRWVALRRRKRGVPPELADLLHR